MGSFYLSHGNNAAALARTAESDPMDLEKAQMRYDRNVSGSADYLRDHWEHIIEAAIDEALSAGVTIDYPHTGQITAEQVSF